MISEAEILDPVQKRLEELLKRPVKARHLGGQDGPDAKFQAGKFLFVVEAKASNRLATVHAACDQARRYARQAGPEAIPLVAVPFMGPTGREACEEAKVSFVDVAGNAHLEAPGLFIHVEGKRGEPTQPGRPASVFAPRSSRVSRLLLLDPKRWWQQKDIADKVGLGRGFISTIVSRLKSDGLLEISDDGRVRPNNPNLLLDAWKDEYVFRKHRIIAGHVASRSGEELVERLVDAARRHAVEYALTGLPAAGLLAPFASFRLVAAYLRKPPKEDLLQDLGFHRGEKGANTWLIVPADDGVFEGSAEVGGKHCVSAVQVYLDLLSMPERAKEAAERLREVCLSWR